MPFFLDFGRENLLAGNVCIGTGVGDCRHCCERPASINGLHGVVVFLLMCVQAEMCVQAAICSQIGLGSAGEQGERI